MENKLIMILFCLLFNSMIFAKPIEYNEIRLQIKKISLNKTYKLELNAFTRFNKEIEGYILKDRKNGIIEGCMQNGDFSFFDNKLLGSIISNINIDQNNKHLSLNNQKILYKYANISKVFSFRINPLLIDTVKDSVNLQIRYIIYEFPIKKHLKLNNGDMIKTKVGCETLRIPFDHDIPVDFINRLFKDNNIVVAVEKLKESSKILTLPDLNGLFNQVKNSTLLSKINIPGIHFEIEFAQTKNGVVSVDNSISSKDHSIHMNENNIGSFTSFKNSVTGEICNLAVPIYYVHFEFPFILYNPQKKESYKNYKSLSEVFKSNYDIIIVPQQIIKDTLWADIFINYSKMNINQIQTWTPIKKHIIIDPFGLKIEMPKENWNVAFERKGDKYQIYGYSDFERYINEYLFINFN